MFPGTLKRRTDRGQKVSSGRDKDLGQQRLAGDDFFFFLVVFIAAVLKDSYNLFSSPHQRLPGDSFINLYRRDESDK